MWVENTKKGYKAVERYTDPVTGQTKRVSVVMEKNTAQARKKAEKILQNKILDKIGTVTGDITLGKVLEKWMEDKQRSVKSSTASTYKSSCEILVSVFGSSTIIDRMTARYVNNMINAAYSEPSKQNYVIKHLKLALRWAYQNDYASDISWLDKIQLRRDDRKKVKLSEKYLEREELEKLLREMPEQWHDLTLFLALTGLRIGEALALEYQDIDLNQRLIHVSKTYYEKTHEVQPAKTADSIRDVFIQDELLPLSKELRAAASARRFIDGKVFPKSYAGYESMMSKYSPLIIGRKISPHVLRHTHVSLLAEQGVPLEVISRRLGHNDTKITKDVYFHTTRKLKEQDNERLKKVAFF